MPDLRQVKVDRVLRQECFFITGLPEWCEFVLNHLDERVTHAVIALHLMAELERLSVDA